jgi:hypothetical protein
MLPAWVEAQQCLSRMFEMAAEQAEQQIPRWPEGLLVMTNLERFVMA